MRITVIYNQVTTSVSGDVLDLLTEQDSIITAKQVKDALRSLRHDVDLLEIREDNLNEIVFHKTDLFFNQAFGIGNLPQTESQVTQILQLSGKPYTGSQKSAIDLSNDKIATKYLLLKNHLPTPKFFAVDSMDRIPKKKLRFPLIVKLSNEHCSLGLKGDSAIYSQDQLYERISNLLNSYRQEILVEEYIDGRELNVTVIGNGSNTEILPVSEIVFGPFFNDRPKVVDFKAKWEEESEEAKETVGVCPAPLPKDLEDRIKQVALEVYELTSCRDYARVDIRLGLDNIPYVLEFNANPSIGKTDGAIRSAKAAGLSYPQFLQKIVDFTLLRQETTAPTPLQARSLAPYSR